MTGFEPRTSVVGSDRSTNCATTTSLEHSYVVELYGQNAFDVICKERPIRKENFNF